MILYNLVVKRLEWRIYSRNLRLLRVVRLVHNHSVWLVHLCYCRRRRLHRTYAHQCELWLANRRNLLCRVLLCRLLRTSARLRPRHPAWHRSWVAFNAIPSHFRCALWLSHFLSNLVVLYQYLLLVLCFSLMLLEQALSARSELALILLQRD